MEIPLKTMVIANPVSGGGRCRKMIHEIQRVLKEKGVHYSFFLSQYAGSAEELAKKAKDNGFQAVIACGGDGTVNEIVNGIIGTGVTLGIIPMGTGRDLAHNLDIDMNIANAIDIISKGGLKSMDLVMVNGGRYYLGVGGIGFDSEVNRWVNKRFCFFKGRFIYTLASLVRVPGFKYKRVKIKLDNESFDGEILLAAFGNTKSYGGGMHITPNADINDGLLDICIIGKINKFKLLYMFPKVFKGTHTEIPEVRNYRSRCVSVESDIPLDFYGDGQFICKTPFSLEVLPKALNVIVPFGVSGV